MGERRKFERYHEKNRAVINYYTRAGSLFHGDFFASIHDLSMGGARLVTPEYFPIDTNLIVSLDLSLVDKFAQMWAKVRWIEKRQTMAVYDMGLEFVQSSDPVEELTRRFRPS